MMDDDKKPSQLHTRHNKYHIQQAPNYIASRPFDTMATHNLR